MKSTTLQITKAGISKVTAPDFVDDMLEFVQKIEASPETIGWRLLLLYIVRTLTGTENDPEVTDADIMDFMRANATEIRRVCRPALGAVRAGEWVQ